MIMFEFAVVLLDKNIQYLLFLARHPLIKGEGTRLEEGNTILNFNSLQERITQLSRGLPMPVPKVEKDPDELDKSDKSC